MVEGASTTAVELKEPRGTNEIPGLQCLESLGLANLEWREGGEVILQVLSNGQVYHRPNSVLL